jgi:hypothetical protein
MPIFAGNRGLSPITVPITMSAKIFLFVTLSCLTLTALADTPQISRGVRVKMATSTFDAGKKDGPGNDSFAVIGQVDILGAANKTGVLSLSGPKDVLKFFTSLPPEVQEKGLWITLFGGTTPTQLDLNKLSELTDGAMKMGLLMHFCKGKAAKTKESGGLVAWECDKVSPKKSVVPLICEPIKLQTGYFEWSCSE